MKSHGNQPDLLRSTDAELAKAYRIAAETAKVDPFWTPEDAHRRAVYYTTMAEQYEGQR